MQFAKRRRRRLDNSSVIRSKLLRTHQTVGDWRHSVDRQRVHEAADEADAAAGEAHRLR
jgi:hypothetical protein